MAKVKIEEIISHLDQEMKKALEDAILNVSDTDIDRNELFRAFVRAVRRKCSTWESVPDRYVEK